MDIEDSTIGQRAREIRAWRRLSLSAVAGLAGMSPGYLSMIERGLRPVTKRKVLEALASALRVDPSELTGKPYTPTDERSAIARTAIAPLLNALCWRLGEFPDAPARTWTAIRADIEHHERLRFSADLAGQAEVVPGLIRDLLSIADDPRTRREVLVALLRVYDNAGGMLLALGVPAGGLLAVERVSQVAEALDDPVWSAVAEWSRVQRHHGVDRSRQYALAVRALDRAPSTHPETVGMLHLTAALSSAVLGDVDRAGTHLREAAELADGLQPDVSLWPGAGMMLFGRTNVAIWRTAIGLEVGEHSWVHDHADAVRLNGISVNRQSAYWVDYGRALLADRSRRGQGVQALLRAEQVAPQHFRNNAYARESVRDLLGSSHSPTSGRELRGLAWRIGIAPKG